MSLLIFIILQLVSKINVFLLICFVTFLINCHRLYCTNTTKITIQIFFLLYIHVWQAENIIQGCLHSTVVSRDLRPANEVVLDSFLKLGEGVGPNFSHVNRKSGLFRITSHCVRHFFLLSNGHFEYSSGSARGNILIHHWKNLYMFRTKIYLVWDFQKNLFAGFITLKIV